MTVSRDQISQLHRHALATAQEGASVARTAEMARLAGLPDTDASGGGSPFEGVGTLDSHVVVLSLPIEVVRDLLPSGLELAPQIVTPTGKHPVFVLLSTDHFEAWFGNMDYHELMIGVPYTQLSDRSAPNRGPFIYMPRLYLDDPVPRRLGNLLYGFEKLEADIRCSATTYEVTDAAGRTLARAEMQDLGTPAAPADFAGFEQVRQLFEQPTVSQALRIVDPNAFYAKDDEGPFLCTTIQYAFGDPKATLQPARIKLDITGALTPSGLEGTYVREGIDTQELGSFRVFVPQVVSLPGSCANTRYPMPAPVRRRRVVVLGAGPAACAAAYYLARQTDRYQVTMYTRGFRMGGKCAAGRNTEAADRIEEHGLHAFVGFYENAFRTVREVYETAGLPVAVGEPPYDYEAGQGPFAGAFIGATDVGVMDRWNGQWRYFATPQTFNGKEPGVVPAGGEDHPHGFGPLVSAALRRVAADAGELLTRRSDGGARLHELFHREKGASRWRALEQAIDGAVHWPTEKLHRLLDELVGYVERLAVHTIKGGIQRGSAVFQGIAWLLGLIRKGLEVYYREEIERDAEAWFTWSSLDVFLTVLIGIIESRTVDFDELDHLDFRQWLLEHGLAPRNRDVSVIVQVYETLFANGSTEPLQADKLAAGVGLRWFLLVALGYRGYPAYEFKYSCPQTLLTPYYEALRRLGVDIQFFHEVRELVVEGQGDDARLVGIRMRKQATVKPGLERYDPFLQPQPPGNPAELPAWPVRPNYGQLVEGEQLQAEDVDLEDAWSPWPGVGDVQLHQGADFDLCVLGIPLGAVPQIAERLIDPSCPTAKPSWKAMVDGMALTQTISLQLWIRSPAEALYSGRRRGLLTGFEQPEPSQADFSHLLQWETWPSGTEPRFLAYHTGALVSGHPLEGHPFSEHEYPKQALQGWKEQANDWLAAHYREMYDRAPETYEGFLDLLVVPPGQSATGEERFFAQYFNIGVQPSDLYVLSQPGATKLRLGQAESGYRNLVLCGDWTRTDMNCGCVEAATQSGMLASRAISNEPVYVWHPGLHVREIEGARIEHGEDDGWPRLWIRLKSAEGEAFHRMSAKQVGSKILVVHEDEVLMSPVVFEPIPGHEIQVLPARLGSTTRADAEAQLDALLTPRTPPDSPGLQAESEKKLNRGA